VPRVYTRDRGGLIAVEQKPVGGDGLVLTAAPAMLPPGAWQVSRNAVTDAGTYARRPGDVKVSRLVDAADTHGAKVFGTTPRYATMPIPLIGKGGFGVYFHHTATRPAATQTRWLWDSGQSLNYATRVIWASLGYNGLFEISVMWSDGTTSDIQVPAAVADGTELHGLLVYDAKAGTLTLYINGDVAGTPITGLTSEMQPYQSVAYPWYLGCTFNPTVGVIANSGPPGALDAFTIFSFKGIEDITDSDSTVEPPRKSLLTELRERCYQDWPNPADPMVLVHYGMDEATAGTGPMYDSSDAQRHGAYFGAPANAAQVARRAQNGQFLGTTKRTNVGDTENGILNVAIAGGQTYYETIREGV
jgi:hypothetical protein